MFELPEMTVLAGQMNRTLQGLTVQKGQLGNSPHKFVWYNRTHAEFEKLTRGKRVGEATVRGRWLSLALEPGYVLLLGECGGRVLYHLAGSKISKKYHLHLAFEDGSFLTATTQMWGAFELYESGEELQREYLKDMRVTPVEPEFTRTYFSALIDSLLEGPKRSAKSLLTQDQLIPGLGNASAQDILFRARLHPRHPLEELDETRRGLLYQAIRDTVEEIIDQGGRYDETDLFNRPGGYERLMDRQTLQKPCPACGGTLKKIQYLGGSCYFCPTCQV